MELSPEESAVLSRLTEKHRNITLGNLSRMTVRERKEWLVRQRIVMGCMEALTAAKNGESHPRLNQMMVRHNNKLTSVNPPLPAWIVEQREKDRAEGWRRYWQEHKPQEVTFPTANTSGRGGFGD
ncbi:MULTISPECIES: hypothetical protein [unclassified Tatumella]|uniref:hypothetical protein n=1 Tax=unclassified Tatumella TaxID=2649542 RepID=UPI001BAEF5A0|nr:MULTISPECIES: hypothetical protein [unclassified Tatumella]MBS0856264.1 hypothetical protein [Tatumella sp. JGM16]MBS0913427.1 hypothetical protein [Tatumella sp. JGM91]